MTMEIDVVLAPPDETDVLVVPVWLDDAGCARTAVDVSGLESPDERAAAAGAVSVIQAVGRRLALVGLGPRCSVVPETLRTAAAVVGGHCNGATALAWPVEPMLPVAPAVQAAAVVEGTLLGCYRPGHWKSSASPAPPKRLAVVSADPAAEGAAHDAAIAARWTNRARELVNAPPNELTPARLAEEAAAIARSVGVDAAILGPAEIEEQEMTAFTAVAAASFTEPRLAVLRYEPAGAEGELLIGLVGKGVTFDSGGLSIKTSESMPRMKADMAGAAAVVCAIAAVAELGLPQRVVAVVPACENSIGPRSVRPGDILESMSGLTVEVVNTDAEGRLLLAEGLCYARGLGATHLVDLGTLTAPAAFGDLYGSLFASDPFLRDCILEAGDASGDLVWPMPLDERFGRLLESDYADIKNMAKADGQSPMGAAFLRRFVDDLPWAHIDFTGPAFLERPRDSLASRGATGFGVRLLVEFVRRFATASTAGRDTLARVPSEA